MFWSELFRRRRDRRRRTAIAVKTYNCAQLFKGSYIGGGTNELERTMVCG